MLFRSRVRVRGHFSNGQGVRLLSTMFTERMPAPHVDRGSPLQIRQRKVHPTIASKGGAKK